ncbi:hypothetical protein GCM10027270_16780 [Nocardioides ginkgobilobae]
MAVSGQFLAAADTRLTWWLNAGVPPTQVASWAGHSVRVLLDVYAGCVDGGEQQALKLLRKD